MVSNTRKILKSSKRSPGKRGFASWFTDQRVWFTLAIFLLLFTLYLAIAFISFIFTGDADQSVLDHSWKELITSPDLRVENKAGKTGAWLADVMINRWFGIPAFLLLYLLTVLGIRMTGFRLNNYKKKFAFVVVTMIWLSLTLGLLFSKSEGGSFLYPGGNMDLWSVTGSA